MYISNSKGETPLSILVSILNRIKDAKMSEVTDDDVMHYLENKNNYPKTKKDEQIIRASLFPGNVKLLEEQPNPDSQSQLGLSPSSLSSDPSNLKLTLINRRKKKLIPSLSPPPSDSSPFTPFKNFFNKVKSPFSGKKKESISFQETIKDLEEGASFIKMKKVDEDESREEERMEDKGRKDEEGKIRRVEVRRRGEEEGKNMQEGGKRWREDEEGGGKREDESKEDEKEEEGEEDGKGANIKKVFERRKIQIKVNKSKYYNK